jgi:hypothetical protein
MPFTIIGMFKHYESEMDRKLREMEKDRPQQTTGPARSRGWGSLVAAAMGGFVYRMKNMTVYVPLQTMLGEISFSQRHEQHARRPALQFYGIKVQDVDHLDQALEQSRNVMLQDASGSRGFFFSQSGRLGGSDY